MVLIRAEVDFDMTESDNQALLRECRVALDDLLTKKPMLAALVCGSTTLGNLRAMLHGYKQTPVQEPAGEVFSASCEFATVRWFRPTSQVGGGDPKNSWSWPITGDHVYVAAPQAQQPRKAVKLTPAEVTLMWVRESFDTMTYESCYVRGVKRGESAALEKNGWTE